MENILTLNQSIFGTKSTERKISRRALAASAHELYVPQDSKEITYDEGFNIDGGKWVPLSATVTLSKGLALGLITGTVAKTVIISALTAKSAAVGASIGGPIGAGISGTITAMGCGILVSKLTQLIGNNIFKEDYKTYNVDLFDVYIPFRNNPLQINIGSLGLE